MIALTQKKRALSLTLLSIMLPISLLATFRITGIIPEPPTPITITLETVNWKIERPSSDVRFNKDVRNVYLDNNVSVSVIFTEYLDNYDWNGLDFLTLMVHFKGSFSSVLAKFQPIDTESALDIDEEILQNPPRHPKAVVNMTLLGIKGVGTVDTEAYVKAKANGSPSSLTILALWVFYDVIENNKDHTLKMTFEVTYFNGTAYRKIIAPATLEVLVREI
jgi:hypothetical protein